MPNKGAKSSADFDRAYRDSFDSGAGKALFLKQGTAKELKQTVLPGINAITISINVYGFGFYSHRIKGNNDQVRCYLNTLLSNNEELAKLPFGTSAKIWVKNDALGQDFVDLSIQGATADEIAKVFPILRSIAQTAVKELETTPLSELLRNSPFWYTRPPIRKEDLSAYG